MKNLLFIAAIVIFTIACNNSGNRNSNSSDTTQTSMESGRQDSLKYYEDRRDSTRLQIDRMKEIIPEKEELKSEWREGINKLEGQLYGLNDKLRDLEKATGNTWNKMKLEIDSAITTMDTTMQNMKLKLKKS